VNVVNASTNATVRALVAALEGALADLAARPLAPIEVAVLDSGVDATHPDLAGRVRAAFAVEIVKGRSEVVAKAADRNHDVFGHGTGVASIIAKQAPNASIVDYRVLDADNTGAGDALVAALDAAVTRGCRVINMSLAAKREFGPRLLAHCERAYREGLVVVAAKRNMPLADLGFPAEYTAVIGVDRASFPSLSIVRYQPKSVIEFVGHGEQVVVAAPGGGYTTKSGTSFATPAIAGLVALLLGAYPDLRPFEIKSILKARAT
jgi:subtilisin family serine protease